jgi:phage terminase large subunit
MQIRVLDFIQGSQQKIPYYLKQLSEKPYAYGTHWLPHDGANEGVGFDKTIEAQVRATRPGDNVQIVPKLDLVDGINALRTMFPGLWFDAERCAAGIECLKNYRYDVKDGQLSRNPVHDWSSHAADAARYMAVALKEGVKRKPLDLGVTPRKLNLGRDQSAGWMGL